MAPGKSLNLRGGSVSPSTRSYDASVIKVGGEVYDSDGYRMDVTVWFRHKNEALYYVDSGGNVHGPMDQRHTARLGNISRSGQYIPGSRYYLSENTSTERFKRRQSDSGAWDAHSDIHNNNVYNTFRSRTYSETRRLNDYSDDLYRSSKGNTITTRYHYSNQQPHFKTTASHNISCHSPQSHISRWSSMQTTGTQGLWRGTNSGRYATTLTRQHIKKHHDPVEMVVKHTPSGGASRVDLLSVDNRQGSLPHLANYSINTSITEREQKLQNELLNTQKELQQLKRSRSLTGDQNLTHSTTLKHTLKSGSSQYLNEGFWTTYSLKKNDGQPCGARIAVQPQRTSSQMNISGPSTIAKTGWLSETNLRNTSVCKQPPMYSTYSAHKENLRRMQEQRRTTEEWQASNRQLQDSRSVGSRAVLEEMETITLQPIGRGVHDLEPPVGSIARSVRATTPSGLSTFTTLMNRPHSSAGRIDLGASGTKRSISKEYYSPIRMQRSTIDIPYSQTTNALISPSINRRLVGFTNINPISTRISNINKNILPTINHDTTMHSNNQLNSKWNIHSSNHSSGIINQSHFNRNSYARQTLTHNIQEITQKHHIQLPNQQYYATPNHNELANRSYAPGWDQQDGFRTIATTNYHRELHTTSGPQSPYLGAVRQTSQYETTPLVVNRSENQWKTVTPFSPTGSLSGTNIGNDAIDGDTSGMRQVLDTSKYWYLPGISRPDVIALLRDKEAGSFVIRNSNTYADSFGLALKIPPNSPRVISNKDDAQSEWVRHFLIGTVPMHDGRGNGVHLRGFSSDPTFPSLAAFVHYHIHRQGALPCTLRLPVQTNQMLYNQQRTTVNDHTVYGLDAPLQTVLPTATTMITDMLYLGSVEVDRFENMNAAIRGISKILSLAQSYSDGLPKRCEVQIKVLPHEGITFTEKYKRGVWKKIIKPNNLLWCGMDPENREFNDIELRSKGMYGSKVFALVARKQRFWLHENVVYVFCEIDNNHPAINLVRFINSIFPGLRD
ncbi:hypothetical protein MN116_008761 [Schistosoma mekongi]|uniref:SH2 domain-containing protein n=1 Tax=Schistosoma mekongi TaxID=38744 RepID=A0AAE1Z6Q0_SCHME|nr:hypothetical protein MN116_008761 [Schistosoma mekongi]